MAALTILSHGYQRNIMGADNQSLCSLQGVVDSFNSGNVNSIKKVYFTYVFKVYMTIVL